VLPLVAIMAATSTLTLALASHGVTSQPYQATRVAAAGPDVVPIVFAPQQGPVTQRQIAALNALRHAPGVTGHSGPYLVAWPVLRVRGITTVADGRRAGHCAGLHRPAETDPGQLDTQRRGGRAGLRRRTRRPHR
jgi:hypothetical protein